MQKKRLAILGSTGSIGRQTLDVVKKYPELFEIELLSANNNSELLIKQALEFDANNVVICNEGKYPEVAAALSKSYTKVFCGIDSICELVRGENIDIVVSAMVGFSGLLPTISAIKEGKIIALANKETLVAAGEIIMKLARKHNAPILPIDSEHSAIFQCLLAAQGNSLAKVHLTASGGPFRTWEKEEIAKATKSSALKHPNWNMGAKISIDSATMMNKGLEVIEAHWLFDIPPQNIKVIIHPESIIHSMVEFEDGAVLAQLGSPDMKQAIQFAINFPQRLDINNKRLDFAKLKSLTFFEVDREKFPSLRLAEEALHKGGNTPCILNAANEVAVKAYLDDVIKFYDINKVVEKCINQVKFIKEACLDDILETHSYTIIKAKEIINLLK